MNEIEFIRRQLAAERAHLLEILEALRRDPGTGQMAQPVAHYLEWADRRLVQQLAAHSSILEAGSSAVTQPLPRIPAGDPGGPAERLLALLETWTAAVDTVTGRTLRSSHWQQAAGVNADAILEERRLYAAARGAMDRP